MSGLDSILDTIAPKSDDAALRQDAPLAAPEPAPAVPTPAAEPVPAAAPVAAPTEPAKPPQGYVPHQALREAREEMRRERDERLALQKRLEALEKPPAAAPTEDTDPIGALRDTRLTLKGVQERLAQRDQAEAAAGQEQQFYQTVDAAERTFSKETPDYYQAVDFLRASRETELKLAYGITDPAKLNQALNLDAAAIASAALRDGISPAQRVYELAKSRGYALKPAEPDPKEHVERLRKGAQAANSLSAAPSRPATTSKPGSIQELLGMEARQFDSQFVGAQNEENWRSYMRRLSGET